MHYCERQWVVLWLFDGLGGILYTVGKFGAVFMNCYKRMHALLEQ